MKKISILIKDNPSWYKEQFQKEARKLKLRINFPEIKNLNDLKIFRKSWGVVFWRSAEIDRYCGKSSALEILKENKSHIVNLANLNRPFITHKLFQQKVLESNKIVNTIPTFTFLNKKELNESIKNNIIKFPFIAKPNIGSQGKGIFLFKKQEDINKSKIMMENYVFQNFMENDGDYRILVIGGRSLGAIKRIAKKGSFLNNVSKGGATEKIKDQDFLLKITSIAERIASKFELGFCGVDLIKDKKTGKIYFLELNTAAQWKGFQKETRKNVSAEILKYFKDIAKRDKEDSVSLVRNYYKDNLTSLLDRKFHYVSRMFLWSGGKKFKKEVQNLKSYYLGDKEEESFKKIKNRLKVKVSDVKINHYSTRKPFFDKYFNLFSYSKVLYFYLFGKTLYEKNLKEAVLEELPKKELLKLSKDLHKDHEGIFVLSTYAINYFYMLEDILEKKIVKPKLYLKILKKYATKSKENLTFAIYLATHCVIGESRFYSRKIVKNRRIYKNMLEFTETLILNNYFEISLDCKLEFLVCCKILNLESILEKMIKQEADKSLSPIGNYLIEKFNFYKNLNDKISFRDSEHRNVLYLMAFSEYER